MDAISGPALRRPGPGGLGLCRRCWGRVNALVQRAQGIKKRHVQRGDAPSNKCLATACWAFIVAKTSGLEVAPPPHSGSLRRTNKDDLSTYFPQPGKTQYNRWSSTTSQAQSAENRAWFVQF
jgi:hypothetical protein